ncbi:MAG TPA: MurR/RpiR family transcriptional regulator [Burkholderiaceae bacterium]|nr:MurR/RpiR family transcriptional regulator [Burkholderiaceae bacterium]
MTASSFTSSIFDLGGTDLSPELLRAARWLEEHPSIAAMQSMRECARRAGLAPATFTRLARALGYDGFDGLKQRFQQALAPDAAYALRARALQAEARRDSGWLEALNEAQHANAASACGLNTPVQFEQAALSMLKAQTVYFLGLRASHGLAFHLYYSYRLLSPNGVLVQDMGGTMSDQLARMGPRDLLVAISLAPYTRQTVLAAEQAVQQGVPLLALTDSALSPLARVAGQTLLFRAQGSSYFQSMVGALALAEALAAAVAVRGGAKVLAHLQAAQSQLTRQGAYWEKTDAKNHAPAKGKE